eukprot:4212783-Amphidinium_carterae.1
MKGNNLQPPQLVAKILSRAMPGHPGENVLRKSCLNPMSQALGQWQRNGCTRHSLHIPCFVATLCLCFSVEKWAHAGVLGTLPSPQKRELSALPSIYNKQHDPKILTRMAAYSISFLTSTFTARISMR